MRNAVYLAWLLVIGSCLETRGDDAPCQVQIVLFVPADVRPPAGYQRRIDEIVSYAEAFFQREFKRWGFEQFVSPFRRSADGHVEVTMMRGKQAAAAYKPVSVRMEVMDANRQQNKI